MSERLDSAPNEVIRRILTALCAKDPDIKTKALKCLDQYAEYYDESEHQEELTTGTKRKAEAPFPEVHLCLNCGEGFLEEENEDDACCYHDGELEYGYEAPTWDDWNQKIFGPRDTDQNRREHPDGFIWDCCDEPGDDKTGCTVEPHEAPVPTHKRKKVSSDSESEFGPGEENGKLGSTQHQPIEL